MKVKDLITKLSTLNPEMEIMILDGFNGGGYPRTINIGPMAENITEACVANCADCEEVGLGVEVYTMGFGCY